MMMMMTKNPVLANLRLNNVLFILKMDISAYFLKISYKLIDLYNLMICIFY